MEFLPVSLLCSFGKPTYIGRMYCLLLVFMLFEIFFFFKKKKKVDYPHLSTFNL